jgi:hypothetical protein
MTSRLNNPKSPRVTTPTPPHQANSSPYRTPRNVASAAIKPVFRTRSPFVRPAAIPTARQGGQQAGAPSASLPAGRGFGTPGPLRSVTSTRMTLFAVLIAIVTVSPGAPEPLCRRLLTKSSSTSKAATSPRGSSGPSTPSTNARATHMRSTRPASITVSRTARPAITAPAFPAARAPEITRATGWTRRDARSTRRPASSPDTSRHPRNAKRGRACGHGPG